MSRFRVRASGPLEGTVQLYGATKNSGLKQMAAALLAPGVTNLHNMPPVRDLDVMMDLLRVTGAQVEVIGDDDHGLLRQGFTIYDALFAYLRFAAQERHNWPAKAA